MAPNPAARLRPSVLAAAVVTAAISLLLFVNCSSSPEDKKNAHRNRGIAYFEKGQFHEALIEFRNVVQLDPNDADAHYRVALTYLRIGDLPSLQRAFAEFTKTTELDPANRDAQLKLGFMLLLNKQPEEAHRRAELVLLANGEDREALILRGQSLIAREQYEDGIEDLAKAVALDPKNIRTRIDIERAYVRMKDLAKAEATLREALSQNPGSIEVRLE